MFLLFGSFRMIFFIFFLSLFFLPNSSYAQWELFDDYKNVVPLAYMEKQRPFIPQYESAKESYLGGNYDIAEKSAVKLLKEVKSKLGETSEVSVSTEVLLGLIYEAKKDDDKSMEYLISARSNSIFLELKKKYSSDKKYSIDLAYFLVERWIHGDESQKSKARIFIPLAIRRLEETIKLLKREKYRRYQEAVPHALRTLALYQVNIDKFSAAAISLKEAIKAQENISGDYYDDVLSDYLNLYYMQEIVDSSSTELLSSTLSTIIDRGKSMNLENSIEYKIALELMKSDEYIHCPINLEKMTIECSDGTITILK